MIGLLEDLAGCYTRHPRKRPSLHGYEECLQAEMQYRLEQDWQLQRRLCSRSLLLQISPNGATIDCLRTQVQCQSGCCALYLGI